MANASGTRRHVAEVSRRLVALLEESVTPKAAVRILAAETLVAQQIETDPEFPLSSALGNTMAREGIVPRSMAAVAEYVRACESRGRGESALRLLGRQSIRRAGGRTSLGVMGAEFVLLIVVVLIYSIFVFPQFEAVFDAGDAPLPAFTRLVFVLIGTSSPFLYVAVLLVLISIVWRTFPRLFGPLIWPVDRLLLGLPLVGPAIRQSHSDRISGWLGYAAADEASQRAALEAAESWYQGDSLGRECTAVLRAAQPGKALSACLAEARGFDREFRAVVSIPDRDDSLAALRARWRVAETLPERQSELGSVLVHIAFGIVVAAVVIAMYQPIFRLGSVLSIN